MRHELKMLALLASVVLASNVLARAPVVINNTNVPDAAPWVEDTSPAAPTFSTEHLLALDMPPHVSIKAGIDPDTISVGTDAVVRYVVVMRNSSGSTMASYEGIRCETREVKTYARRNSLGEWVALSEPVWRDLNATMPSHHAQVFAGQAACKEGGTPTRSGILDVMKNGFNPALNIH